MSSFNAVSAPIVLRVMSRELNQAAMSTMMTGTASTTAPLPASCGRSGRYVIHAMAARERSPAATGRADSSRSVFQDCLSVATSPGFRESPGSEAIVSVERDEGASTRPSGDRISALTTPGSRDTSSAALATAPGLLASSAERALAASQFVSADARDEAVALSTRCCQRISGMTVARKTIAASPATCSSTKNVQEPFTTRGFARPIEPTAAGVLVRAWGRGEGNSRSTGLGGEDVRDGAAGGVTNRVLSSSWDAAGGAGGVVEGRAGRAAGGVGGGENRVLSESSWPEAGAGAVSTGFAAGGAVGFGAGGAATGGGKNLVLSSVSSTLFGAGAAGFSAGGAGLGRSAVAGPLARMPGTAIVGRSASETGCGGGGGGGGAAAGAVRGGAISAVASASTGETDAEIGAASSTYVTWRCPTWTMSPGRRIAWVVLMPLIRMPLRLPRSRTTTSLAPDTNSTWRRESSGSASLMSHDGSRPTTIVPTSSSSR